MAEPKYKITELESLTGVQKAAILVMALGQDTASNIVRLLPETDLEELTSELATMGSVAPPVRQAVVEEFYSLAMSQAWAGEGGLDFARSLLEGIDPAVAERIFSQATRQVQKTPFSFLQRAETENLLAFIQDEHPQTIAVILSHLSHQKSSEILQGLPTDRQIEVVRRVATMDQTNPEIIKEVEAGLRSRLSTLLTQSFEKAGGVEPIAEILNLVDRGTERAVLEGLEPDDPELVENIRRLMFVFEDIVKVSDKSIQIILKEVDNQELSLALKTASDELKEKIFRNMSERAVQLVQEEMDFMGPVRISDVESAQQRIVDIVRRLEDAGEIIIGESDLVV
ncbi:MAG: flagellar motor switch protein FliG [Phycisphaeraceae bacterium]|nr:flagellar motor switch protein FliG [Phycisphaeraceae bacterium]